MTNTVIAAAGASVTPAIGLAHRGRAGLWRALAAAPAMAGSVLLLVVAFGWLGPWEVLVLGGWLMAGALALTRAGERASVRARFGFRRPTRQQTAVLAAAWGSALASYQLPANAVDLYVQRSTQPNAYAAGGRSVAVTTAIVAQVVARHLGRDELTAVLVHELGHLDDGRGSRLDLAVGWLAAPWRAASGLVEGLVAQFAGRQPRILLVLVGSAGAVIAIGQLAAARLWAATIVLSAVAIGAVACPLVEAAISRRGEYAADAHAAAAGHGPALARALSVLEPGIPHVPRLTERLLASHPDIGRRVDRLATTPRYLRRPLPGGVHRSPRPGPREGAPVLPSGPHPARDADPDSKGEHHDDRS